MDIEITDKMREAQNKVLADVRNFESGTMAAHEASLRAAIAASPLMAELERVTGERDEMRAKLAALESSPRVVVTREMAKLAMTTYVLAGNAEPVDDMLAALQAVFGAAPESVPEPATPPAAVPQYVTRGEFEAMRRG